jgi:transposase-like protein
MFSRIHRSSQCHTLIETWEARVARRESKAVLWNDNGTCTFHELRHGNAFYNRRLPCFTGKVALGWWVRNITLGKRKWLIASEASFD